MPFPSYIPYTFHIIFAYSWWHIIHSLAWMNIIVTHFNNRKHWHTRKQTPRTRVWLTFMCIYVMMMMILDWQLRTLMLYYSWFHSLSYLIWRYSSNSTEKISISLNTYTNNAHFIILLSQHCPPFSFHFKCLSFSTQHGEPFLNKK